MNSDEYKKIYELEDLYWWFIGRRKLVKWLLQEHTPNGKESRLFDLGCGTGLNVSTFATEYKTFGSDLSP